MNYQKRKTKDLLLYGNYFEKEVKITTFRKIKCFFTKEPLNKKRINPLKMKLS